MIKVEGSVMINRPVEKVWSFLTNVANAPTWDTGIIEARQTSEGPPGVGTTIQAVRHYLGRRVIMNVLITEYDLNKRLAFTNVFWLGTGRVRYTFEPAGSGAKLSKSAEAELKGLFKLLEPILSRRFRVEETEFDLGNIKRLVEAQA